MGDETRTEPDDRTPKGGLSRRRALQVLAAGAAGAAALPAAACSDATPDTTSAGGTTAPGASPAPGSPTVGNALARGTATDPDLIRPVVPWDGVLTDDELQTLAALCDEIIPADDASPSASAVGAHSFIDEWVSAPYDGNREDLILVRGGLLWLDREAEARFGEAFASLPGDRKRAICDDICFAERARPEHRAAARFFDKVRDLTSTAFWTTEEGMADLGFVGNRAMDRFEGPPPEVLQRLGLA